jgi:hypothetical protein
LEVLDRCFCMPRAADRDLCYLLWAAATVPRWADSPYPDGKGETCGDLPMENKVPPGKNGELMVIQWIFPISIRVH